MISAISFVLLACGAFLSKEVLRDIALAPFWSSLLTLGIGVHLRRSTSFIHNNAEILFLFITTYSLLAIFSHGILESLGIPILSPLMIRLAITHCFSMLLFDALTNYLRNKLLVVLMDIGTLVALNVTAILAEFYELYDYLFCIILIFKFGVLFVLRFNFYFRDEFFGAVDLNEFVRSFGANSVAVLPMILITHTYLDLQDANMEYGVVLLRITAIANIILVSHFNFERSKKTLPNNEVKRGYSVLFLVLGLISTCAIITIIQYLQIPPIFFVSLLPVITFFGAYSKINLQFSRGSKVILLFNIIVFLSVVGIVILNLGFVTIFLAYAVLYIVSLNFYHVVTLK